MTRRIVTLTTDFGWGSYVAQMKSVILNADRNVQLIDVDHDVSPQSVMEGAIVLRETVRRFPPDTVHLAVIDPGVGTDRHILVVESEAGIFVLPDNGLVSLVLLQHPAKRVVVADRPEFWGRSVSSTFHGRDIMAPLVGAILRGTPVVDLGTEVALDSVVHLQLPAVSIGDGKLLGEVLYFDRFGNAITNICTRTLREYFPNAEKHDAEACHASCAKEPKIPIVEAYGQRPVGTVVALIGSGGYLEIACVNGNARERMQLKVGDRVIVANTAT